MFPLIALAAISVASSIAGGISANKKQRKADQIRYSVTASGTSRSGTTPK